MTESGKRRAWVGFSALAFAICGVLLLVQFQGRLASPAPATESLGAPSPSPTSTAPLPTPPPPPIQTPTTTPILEKPVLEPKLSDVTERGGSPDVDGVPGGLGVTPPEKHPPSKTGKPTAPGKGSKPDKGFGHGEGTLGSGDGTSKDPQLDRKKIVPRSPITAPSAGGMLPTGVPLGGPPSPPAKDTDGSTATATPTPTAPSPDGLIEGTLKVNVPPAMVIGQSEHIRAVIGAKLSSAAVDKEAAIEAADGPKVQIGRDLLISTLVRMELRPDSPADFDITAISPDATQRIYDREATVWEWAVTPKQEGRHSLTLLVIDLKDVKDAKDAPREPLRSKFYSVQIEVRVSAWQRVRDVAVSGSSILSGLAGLIGAWLGLLRPLLQRRQPGGEAGAPAPRAPTHATTAAAAPTHAPHVPSAAHAAAVSSDIAVAAAPMVSVGLAAEHHAAGTSQAASPVAAGPVVASPVAAAPTAPAVTMGSVGETGAAAPVKDKPAVG